VCKAEELRDYGAGFEKLRQLGLPDVSTGTYVNLETYFPGSISVDIDGLELGGNSWLLHEDKAAASAFVHNHARYIQIFDARNLSKIVEKESEELSEKDRRHAIERSRYFGSSGRFGGTWEAADLKADANKVLEWLEKFESSKDEFRWELESGGWGHLFLAAAQFRSKGLTNESNRIAGELFRLSPDPKQVILHGVNQLADSQYEEAYARLRRTKDWGSYGENLLSLLQRFPKGWRSGPAVSKLRKLVEERLQLHEPPPLQGDGLSAEDQEIARDLASAGPDDLRYSGIWTLPGSGGRKRGATTSVVQRITERGMDAIPLLVNMLPDSYLLEVDRGEVLGSGLNYSSGFGALMDDGFDSMNRPQTRGDVARNMLADVFVADEDYEPADLNELTEEILAWFEEHREQSTTDLADLYLRTGGWGEQNWVVGYMSKSEDPALVQALEEYLLETEDFSDKSRFVRQHILWNPEKTKPFFEKYRELFSGSSTAESFSDDDELDEISEFSTAESFSDDDELDEISEVIKELERIYSGGSIEEILDRVIRGETTLQDEKSLLRQRLSQLSPAGGITKLLEAATNADDVEFRRELIHMIAMGARFDLYNSLYNESYYVAEEEEPEPLSVEDHRDMWQELMQDSRFAPGRRYLPRIKVSILAAATVETLYNPNEAERVESVVSQLGDRGHEIIEKRARAILAGGEIPPMPNSTHVPGQRQDEILATLESSDVSDLPERLAELSHEELLAIVEKHGQRESLNAHLLSVANRIVRIDMDSDTIPVPDNPADGWRNRTLDRAIIDQAAELCGKAAAAGEPLLVVIQRNSALEGIEIRVQRPREDREKNEMPVVSAMAGFGDERWVRAGWAVPADTDDEEEAGVGSIDGNDDIIVDSVDLDDLLNESYGRSARYPESPTDEANEEFWNAIDDFCTKPLNVWQESWIHIIGTPVPDEPESEDGGDHD
jgi:hypothetical protein